MMPKFAPRSNHRRVTKASATGVLGEYNHSVTFRDDADFAIVFGPNGVGKTRFLEIIDALSNLRISRLQSLPFDSAMLQFSDGWALMVSRESADLQELPDLHGTEAFMRDTWRELVKHHGAEVEGGRVNVLSFQLMSPDGQVETAPPVIVDLQRDDDMSDWMLAASLQEEWSTDRALPPREVIRRIRNMGAHAQRTAGHLPEDFQSFARGLDVRLIETQRLLTMELDERANRKERTSRPTIEAYSEIIRRQLEVDLSNSSRVGQQLDSTFPSRMLEAGESSRLSPEEIHGRLEDQRTRRARIEQITPLGLNAFIPLPEGELTNAQKSVLELYLGDADDKLSTFAPTVRKIDMLEETINARLLGKRLTISAVDGIVIRRDSDNERIPLIALSSGEQHEIIMIFDLLFNVKKGGLVLIDEPEISLHIVWQQQFIADVLKIARLVGFQFIIATHSPQIIDGFWPQAQRLGPPTAPFEGANDKQRNA